MSAAGSPWRPSRRSRKAGAERQLARRRRAGKALLAPSSQRISSVPPPCVRLRSSGRIGRAPPLFLSSSAEGRSRSSLSPARQPDGEPGERVERGGEGAEEQDDPRF